MDTNTKEELLAKLQAIRESMWLEGNAIANESVRAAEEACKARAERRMPRF